MPSHRVDSGGLILLVQYQVLACVGLSPFLALTGALAQHAALQIRKSSHNLSRTISVVPKRPEEAAAVLRSNWSALRVLPGGAFEQMRVQIR